MQPSPSAPQRNRRADRYRQEEATPPPVMQRPQRPKPRESEKLPTWMTAGILSGLVIILALVAAQNMMEAYLYQRKEAREAAYHQVVNSHPVYYMDLIQQYADENNLQPAFVSAIILKESSFNTRAESSVGARGLMQLMPDTAQWIAGKLGDAHYSFDHMWDAEQNIRYGTWYLGYLSRLFRGDPVTVASAYHAGQSTVSAWLGDTSMSPDGIALRLEGMKDGPTKTYAGRVTQAYAIYDTLYYQADASAAAVPAAAD